MEAGTAAIDVALEKIDAHSAILRTAKEGTLEDDALALLISSSLNFHREERARWRKAVQYLPAHLKEQVLSEDLGGMVDSSVSISNTNPATPQQAVRLPPPNPNAFRMLTPTASAAAVELRQNRAGGGDANLPAEQVTPEPSISVRAGGAGHGTPLVLPSKDPLRSARASPAQLPQGGLTELQKVLAKRRGGE